MVSPTALLNQDATLPQATWRFLFRSALLAAALLSCLLGLLLVVRALGGHLTPFTTATAGVIGMVLAVLTWAWHMAWQRVNGRDVRSGHRAGVVASVPIVAAGLVATALSISMSSAGLLLYWFPLVLVAGWIWYGGSLERGSRSPRRDREQVGRGGQEAVPAWPVPRDAQAQVVQQTERSVTGEFDEFVGRFRCAWAPHERTQVVHVAFCPPFAGVPHVEARQISGTQVQVKLAPAQPYGVRVELRLVRAAAEPAAVLLEVAARLSIA